MANIFIALLCVSPDFCDPTIHLNLLLNFLSLNTMSPTFSFGCVMIPTATRGAKLQYVTVVRNNLLAKGEDRGTRGQTLPTSTPVGLLSSIRMVIRPHPAAIVNMTEARLPFGDVILKATKSAKKGGYGG